MRQMEPGKPSKGKFSKLRMPDASAEPIDMGEGTEMDSEGGMDDSDESGPSMDEAVNEEQMESPSPLAGVEDAELMAEVEKRGLMHSMGKPKSKGSSYSEM